MTEYEVMTWNEWIRFENRLKDISLETSEQVKFERLQLAKSDLKSAYGVPENGCLRAKRMYQRVKSMTPLVIT